MANEMLNMLAAQIIPCDRTKPYFYVSYSTRDGEMVYQTVRALQNKGLNLWVDVESNFNTGEGYNSTIFSAIADPNCNGLLFFMSVESLTSAQCAKEMAYIESHAVINARGRALPVVGVELSEIENHDLELWVEGELYQRFQNEMLSLAEAERIEKYRKKYNNKMDSMATRYDLAESICKILMRTEAKRVDYGDAPNAAAIFAALSLLS